MALPTKLGPLTASFAVDTGAAVNVLSEEAYSVLKRASRGGRYCLRPSDLNLVGVTSDSMDIKGIVRLPVSLGKHTPIMRLDFYVASNFALPTDGLLGLPSLKSTGMTIIPDSNSVNIFGKTFRAMDKPERLTCLWERSHRGAVDTSAPLASSTVPQTDQTADMHQDWATVNALVIGNHEIPQKTAAHIPVSVPNATVGNDICLEGPCNISSLAVESTLNTVREGQRTVALVVNTTAGPVKLRQGVLLTRALVFNGQVMPDPAQLPSSCVGAVHNSGIGAEVSASSSLDSHVKVIDYPEHRPSLLKLLNKFRDVIALPGETLGATDRAEHIIRLKPNTKPVYIPAYRLPHSHRQVVDEQVEDMLQQGVIQHSRSPWNSPLFLVPKKDGNFRPVIDFRKVNDVTEDDRFPLPVLSDLLMSLGHGNKVFSSLDLLSGYWQVPLHPKSREITAFSTPTGHFEWLRMPFGLKTAPITFQRMINHLFADKLGKGVYAYLDDLLVCGKDMDSHFKNLETVLSTLKAAGLKAKLTKCEFLKSKISFLGHKIDGDGIHTMDDKIVAIKNFPRPKSVENVRSFLGLCGYYRSFIDGFSKLASPLTQLLKKDIPFHWNTLQETSFQTLKEALTHAPVLAFPDYTLPFVMYTDASALGLGAVLMQQDARGKNRAIAYASRTLNQAESNYSVTHQETLAIVWALKHFRDIILGYPITVFTDHAPVTDLFKGRNLTGRLARWYLTIQEFNPTFRFLPDRANRVADCLSRNVPIASVTAEKHVIDNFSFADLAEAQRKHDLWQRVIYALESGDDTNLPSLPIPFNQFFLSEEKVLCRYWPAKKSGVVQYVVPECFVPAVLHLVHDAVLAGHPGKERTLTAARQTYFWPTMRTDIEAHVSKCLQCAQHKGTVPRPAPILEYPPPARPWDVVSLDLLQLPTSRQGSKYLLVCVDHLSRYVVLAPLRDKSAKTVAHALVSHLFCPHTAPKVLLSDNGAEFRNQLLDAISQQYGVKQCFTVTYHPASNGLVERANRKILEVLRPAVGDLMEHWEDWLPHVAACINGSVCESTGQTPHFILYGSDKRLPYHLLLNTQPPVYNPDDYVKSQLQVFSDIHKTVREKLHCTNAAMCAQQHKRADPVTLQVGDSVMLRVPDRESKLSPKFQGPRYITQRLDGHKFVLWDPTSQTFETVHSDRLKRTEAEPEDRGVPPPSTPVDSLPRPASSHQYNLRPRQ